MPHREAYERFTCACGVRCIMIPHVTTNNLAPIEVTKKPGGNIRLEFPGGEGSPGFYAIVPKREREATPDEPRFWNHWGRCTAPEFQRQGAQRADSRRRT